MLIHTWVKSLERGRCKVPPSISVDIVAPCQLALLAFLHFHPSCYHVPTADKAALGQSWSCHRHRVGVQDNCRVVQLLPALSVPTMVCLCSERSGRVVLATFKPFLETCDCVRGAQLCCRELTDCVCCHRFEGIEWFRGVYSCLCVFLYFYI